VQRATKRIAKAIIVLLGIPVAAFAAVTGAVSLRPRVEAYLQSTKFDPVGWKTRSRDDGASWPTRLRMVDDLLDRGLLKGASRAHVEELLGPPDDTVYFREWDLVYWLGPERGATRIDSEWLVLRLDPSGKVVEQRLMRD